MGNSRMCFTRHMEGDGEIMSISPLALTGEQTRRLFAYIQTYRRYLLTQTLPSAERNAHQRQLQTLQGKLMRESEQGLPGVTFPLSLTNEEVSALKTMVDDLLSLTQLEPANPQRDATLADLSGLKVALANRSPCGPVKHPTSTLL